MTLSIALALLLFAASPSVQDVKTTSAASRLATTLPSPRYTGSDRFLTAIEIDQQISTMVGSFYGPAIAALVAANPGHPDQARSFGNQLRDRETAVYRPLVRFTLENRAVELLHPEVAQRLRQFQAKVAQSVRAGPMTEAQRTRFYAEQQTITREAESRVNVDFDALSKIAGTSDGRAVRALARQGLPQCLDYGAPRKKVVYASKEGQARHDAACAGLLANSAIKRLQASAAGQQYINVSTATYVMLAGMVAMKHDAGLSLHLLLPPKRISEAGLAVPANASIEELTKRYGTSEVSQ